MQTIYTMESKPDVESDGRLSSLADGSKDRRDRLQQLGDKMGFKNSFYNVLLAMFAGTG